MSTSSVEPFPPVQKAGRVHVWDNYKALLIFLVVFGHLISTIRNTNSVYDGLYDFVYLFHMPVMILISGLFAKETIPTVNNITKNIINLLGVWLIFEIVWVGFRLLYGNTGISSNFLTIPSWTLWFLVTLFTMKVLLPYILWFKYPLLLTIGVALIAGFSSQIGPEFSFARTLTFLPFFLIGYKLRNDSFKGKNLFNHPWLVEKTPFAIKLISIVVVVVAVIAFYLNSQNDVFERLSTWLLWRDNYRELYDVIWFAPVIKFSLLGLSLILMTAIFFLMPKQKTWFTSFGEKTLYIYLLHSFIVYSLREAGIVDKIATDNSLFAGLAIFVALSCVIFLITGNKYTAKIFKVLFEPQWLSRFQSSRLN